MNPYIYICTLFYSGTSFDPWLPPRVWWHHACLPELIRHQNEGGWKVTSAGNCFSLSFFRTQKRYVGSLTCLYEIVRYIFKAFSYMYITYVHEFIWVHFCCQPDPLRDFFTRDTCHNIEEEYLDKLQRILGAMPTVGLPTEITKITEGVYMGSKYHIFHILTMYSSLLLFFRTPVYRRFGLTDQRPCPPPVCVFDYITHTGTDLLWWRVTAVDTYM